MGCLPHDDLVSEWVRETGQEHLVRGPERCLGEEGVWTEVRGQVHLTVQLTVPEQSWEPLEGRSPTA